ncbi:hypothetical protein ACHAXS_012727 [Conticribra weissflogii]
MTSMKIISNDTADTSDGWRNNVLFVPLEILVPGSKPLMTTTPATGRQSTSIPLLHTNTPLSFWGGVDPETSQIVDTSHPLSAAKNLSGLNSSTIKDTILCLPSGRGSCTASQALLQLILNDNAPNAIVLKETDSILCVGAIVAREVFQDEVLGKVELNDGTIKPPNGKAPLIAKVLDRDDRDWAWMPPSLSKKNLHCAMDSSSLFSAIGSSGFNHSSIILLPQKGEDDTLARMAILVAASDEHYLQIGLNEIYSTNMSPGSPISFPAVVDKNELQLTPEETYLLNGTTTKLSSLEVQEISKKCTPVHKLAMRIICQIAKIENATRLQEVTKAHIDGCTYVGEGGRRFVRRLVELSGVDDKHSDSCESFNDGSRIEPINSILAVPTTLNSISTDICNWETLGIPAKTSHPARDVAQQYMKLGCRGDSLTCAPYLVDDFSPTEFGEHLVWGESNAVVYANSVLGARTNKTADYMDICAALIGKVPFTGVYVDKERLPQVVLDGRELFQECATLVLYSKTIVACCECYYFNICHVGNLLKCAIHGVGVTNTYHVFTKLSGGKVPLILLGLEEHDGIEHWKYPILDDLKSFSAAFGTTASAPLFHIAGITPEAREHANVETMIQSIGSDERNWRKIDLEDLRRGYEALNLNCGEDNADTQKSLLEDDKEPIKLVALGNPHLSLSECRELNSLVSSGLKKHNNSRVIATLGRRVRSEADRLGYISALEKFGVEFVSDTCWCMLLDPPIIPLSKTDKILTNSAKYAMWFANITLTTDNFAVLKHYGPGLTERKYRFGGLRECIDVAVLGYRRKTYSCMPIWLKRTYTTLSFVI